jgi:hypothetical protein
MFAEGAAGSSRLDGAAGLKQNYDFAVAETAHPVNTLISDGPPASHHWNDSGVPNVVWMGTIKRTARGNGEKLWQKHYPAQLLGSLHLDSSQCLLLMRTLRKPLASAKAKALLPINAVAAMQSGDLAKAQIQKPRHSERCMSDIPLNL